ncbi:MAG: CBS domain-containing protein [Candidatus Promineifilaceae bacterium]|nr:CBS domain-containing protein [Candidatus Promineifilaceae bacterium]
MKLMRILATKTGDVITVHPEQQIREAVRLLSEHNIGALVVVDAAGKPVGIISERDIVRRAADNEGVLAEQVRDIMTRRVIIGMPQDDLYSVINTMTEKRFRHLPIMDEGRLIGIISIGDVLKAQRDAYQGEIDTLETQIMADEA